MTAATIPAQLQDAVETEALVTVTTIDGRVLLGQLRDHPTEPLQYVVRTGRRGRPAVFHEDDVEGVTFE